jgi:hypothetical protein
MVINDSDCRPGPSTPPTNHIVQLIRLFHFKSPEKDSKNAMVTITVALICTIWSLCNAVIQYDKNPKLRFSAERGLWLFIQQILEQFYVRWQLKSLLT